MNTLVNFRNIAAIAFFAVTSVAGFSAFKSADQSSVKRVAPVTYYYQSSSDATEETRNTDNWTSVSPGTCSGTAHLCAVTIDGSTYPTLNAFLASNPSKAEIESSAINVDYKN